MAGYRKTYLSSCRKNESINTLFFFLLFKVLTRASLRSIYNNRRHMHRFNSPQLTAVGKFFVPSYIIIHTIFAIYSSFFRSHKKSSLFSYNFLYHTFILSISPKIFVLFTSLPEKTYPSLAKVTFIPALADLAIV